MNYLCLHCYHAFILFRLSIDLQSMNIHKHTHTHTSARTVTISAYAKIRVTSDLPKWEDYLHWGASALQYKIFRQHDGMLSQPLTGAI
jgi:hypothetical protein